MDFSNLWLVNGQVNDQNPLVQLRFLARKMRLLISRRKIYYGYSFEAPRWDVYNECLQHTFSLRNKKNIFHNLDTFLKSYEVLVLGQVNWNFLLVLREMGQVGQIENCICTALVKIKSAMRRIFPGSSEVSQVYEQQRLWSACANVQSVLNFVGRKKAKASKGRFIFRFKCRLLLFKFNLLTSEAL